METSKKVLTIFSLVVVIVFLPISPSSLSELFSRANVDSYGNITGTEIWDHDMTINAEYTVQPGATLIIKPGVTVTFIWGSIDIKGNMFVNGTLNNPVTIKKGGNWDYYINVEESGKLVVKNADISGAGLGPCTLRSNAVFNKALACPIMDGINVLGGWLDIEGSNIHNNTTAIYISNKNLNRIKVNRSKFSNNKNYDVRYGGLSGSQVNFEYNWWGSPDGPVAACWSPGDCYHKNFTVDVDFSHYLTQPDFHDPVLIVPGIFGSAKWTDNGDWKLDPIFKTYDSLYKTFEDNGYKEGVDLFSMPYQWRASNVDTAKLLQAKIQEIKTATHWPKVDVVAHSMGGLVTRQYIESNDYQGDIDQLVMIGTPNSGAPEDYITWESGDMAYGKFDVVGFFLNKIFYQEAKENNFSSVFDYLHTN